MMNNEDILVKLNNGIDSKEKQKLTNEPNNKSNHHDKIDMIQEKIDNINFLNSNFLNNKSIKYKSQRLNNIVNQKINKNYDLIKINEKNNPNEKLKFKTERSRNTTSSINNFCTNSRILLQNKKSFLSGGFNFSNNLNLVEKSSFYSKKNQTKFESESFSKSIKLNRLTENTIDTTATPISILKPRKTKIDSTEFFMTRIQKKNSVKIEPEKIERKSKFKSIEMLNNFLISDFRLGKLYTDRKSIMYSNYSENFPIKNPEKSRKSSMFSSISELNTNRVNDESGDNENNKLLKKQKKNSEKNSEKLSEKILNISCKEYEKIRQVDSETINDPLVNQNNLKRLIKLRNIMKSNKNTFLNFEAQQNMKNISKFQNQKELALKIKLTTPNFIKNKFNSKTTRTFIRCDGNFVF